jgi:small subunit ribosomal protein S1
MNFYPEGTLIDMPQNKQRTSSLFSLGEAAQSGEVLEGRAVVCDTGHNLTVALGGGLQGIIPRVEGAIGIEEGLTRDIAIISRVNKPVSFVVTGFEAVGGQISPMLSRRAAQQKCLAQYVSELAPGQIIGARVTHLETFGCFVDIGCGLPSMIPSTRFPFRAFHTARALPHRAGHPRGRQIGRGRRVCLTHKELLGTWEENAALFSSGQTVAGVIRSVEPYGIFVELTPNLAGLAEPRDGVQCGQHASVYIKSLIAQK